MVTVCSWKEPRTVTAVSAMVLGTMVLAVIRVSITEAAALVGRLTLVGVAIHLNKRCLFQVSLAKKS